MEMSPNPEAALNACNVLRHLETDAGHVIHMASHIDVLVGQYADGVQANARALLADNKCIDNDGGGTEGTIYVGYISHDYHMLVYAAMLGGMESAARKASLELMTRLTEEGLQHSPRRLGLPKT